MTKKKSDSKKPLSKKVAQVMTATLAASTVVAVLPADFIKADMFQGDSVSDSVYDQSTTVTDSVYVQPFVQALEAVRVADSAATLQQALSAVELALNLTGYNELSPLDQEAVAQALLSAGNYADTAELQDALNKAVAVQRDAVALRNAVAAVNSADSAAQIQSALEAPYLGLILINYRKLNADGKLAAAETVREAVPAGGYNGRTDIQKAFNEAIASVFEAQAQ
ncbi:hypothetical protein [Paenibacillus sp. FJAT-27812]|uniref:hypothetical protein n=1 Tax=Paenibacillus sp. FJAT-27812 TaxID=1684143 RepID=UPI0006A7A894|nr:hypothetical protein [Paenibacillus sp. FJAT-27812]